MMKLLTLLIAGAALPLTSAAPASTAIVKDASSADTDASVAATLARSSKDIYPAKCPENVNGFNYTYPSTLWFYNLTSTVPGSSEVLEMAFMDLLPPNYNPRNAGNKEPQTILLLHGKNFCGPTWYAAATPLQKAGYRVILPEQLGFCKSTKPTQYSFNLTSLATNTRNLVKALGITKPPIVIGHSLGGMLASRYALTYPEFTKSLMLVSPIGLEDWKQLGVPDRSFDLLTGDEKSTTYASLRGYEQATYYPGAEWTEDFDKWVVMLTKVYEGDQKEKFWADQAHVVEMVLGQPTIHDYNKIKPKTLLVVGEKDNTAIGKVWSPPEVQAKLGHYAVLGRQAQAVIPDATLVSFPYLGHAPQIQEPEMFNRLLASWVKTGGRTLESLKLNATIIR
ncbi:alpha/beta-hydrolase [Neurospora crassa]|uniref:Alpha/beta hydrolase fold protein n=1 Tax=Neurospora crassa (strain ATCC 24698 / 74-OR23-1A / CBS 708.71 / DSM 1257 / FGSC 987) TaxID=367110 RepID=Q7SHK0_NEUCR|nr:alpha/beta hydrolase fold protein [Neurospora crassa OR74A]EAA36350.1 alpha/beta hydrolase fold protein [Neurospora crassa OR74A]KHE89325.1 alpha/beta-hydrolase [Neurospora crassa]|eukprot:XP_965586.1 alpha/beta hydrolase fold protein [Neurospora crassa OR74A]